MKEGDLCLHARKHFERVLPSSASVVGRAACKLLGRTVGRKAEQKVYEPLVLSTITAYRHQFWTRRAGGGHLCRRFPVMGSVNLALWAPRHSGACHLTDFLNYS